MSETKIQLDPRALEAAIAAVEQKRPAMENPSRLSIGAIAEAAVYAYLAALSAPEPTAIHPAKPPSANPA